MNYIYRDIDGQTFVMTDDSEDVYIEPVPTPEPAPYVPTLDDVKLSKSTEIISIYNNVMTTGTNATLSDGIIVNDPKIRLPFSHFKFDFNSANLNSSFPFVIVNEFPFNVILVEDERGLSPSISNE